MQDAIAGADTVVFAIWLDAMRELIPQVAPLLDGKVVIDPSNPIAFDERGQVVLSLPEGQSAGSVAAALLPKNAHYVKAFGTLAAAGGALLRNRRRNRRDHRRAADPRGRVRPRQGRQRGRRRTNRGARRRPAPVRLQWRGRRPRPGVHRCNAHHQ
ncbi:hypothetical protein ABT186_22355 [Streptomyces sp. NPDC001634]|uniref:hypothetical protein n=1 Tax=Streptomyces sp. NPDC001634 TaxID=3154390 RepID=UPI003317B1B2